MNLKLHAWIASRVRFYIDKARELYSNHPTKRVEAKRITRGDYYPKISYHDRKAAAGTAYYNRHAVSFHEVLATENGEAFDQTIGHEIAHLVAYCIFGETGHGKNWKRVMRDFGLEVRRCHNYDVANAGIRRQTRFAFVCGCASGKVHHISATVKNRIDQGVGYRCTDCKKVLRHISANKSAAESPVFVPGQDSEAKKKVADIKAEFPNIQHVTARAGGGWKVYVRGVNGYFFADDDEVLKAQLPILNRKGTER